MFTRIKKQRESLVAPVDKFGLTAINNNFTGDQKSFLMLVSLLLSSQTKDEYNFETMQKFVDLAITSFEKLASCDLEYIKKLIRRIGFANKKAIYLKELAEEYKNKQIPSDIDKLLKIKGIGMKMAILYLNHTTDRINGIGVDTHVFRVSKRLGIHAKTPEKCEKQLQLLFDISEWKSINYVLVGFGQEICKAKRPRCNICDIRNDCKSKDKKIMDW